MNAKFVAGLLTVLTSAGATLGLPAFADGENRAVKIFSADIAQKILGTPVKSSQCNNLPDMKTDVGWMSRAFYTPSVSGSGRTAGVMMRSAGSKQATETMFKHSKEIYHGIDVAGIGDSAYRTNKPDQLNVLKGDTWIIISVGKMGVGDPAGQENLAKELLPKLN